MQNKHFNKFAQDNEKAELKSKYCNIKERIMNIELSVKRNHLKTANLQRNAHKKLLDNNQKNKN